jgi:hypothetical protein
MKDKQYNVTPEQLEKIKEKYEKLIFMISHRVGGDPITNSFDDSVQDLYISALDAVRTYSKKTDETFEEFFDTVEFDKYIKTCLWNRKNNSGAKIQKRKPISKYVTIEEDILSLEDLFQGDETRMDLSGFGEVLIDMDEQSQDLVRTILQDGKMIKPNGNVNINRLARETGFSKQKLKSVFNQIRIAYREYNE